MAHVAAVDKPSSHTPNRIFLVLLAAIAIHLTPLLLLTMSAPRKFEAPEIMAVNFVSTRQLDDETLPALAAKTGKAQPFSPSSTPIVPPTAPPTKAVPPPHALEKAPEAKPDEAKPAEAKPIEASKPEAPPPAPQNEKPPAAMDLPPLKPTTAFDESKSTKVAPLGDAYLSDRTSTAADRGPKNLPRGDPYMDKGESTEIRYRQKRGEGNLPQLAVDANSGSVKKEGSPEAGRGPREKERAPGRETPRATLPPPALKAPEEEKGLAPPTEARRPGGRRDVPEAMPAPKRPDAPEPEAVARKIENKEGEGAAPDKLEKSVAPEPPKPDLKLGPIPGPERYVAEAKPFEDAPERTAEQKERNAEAPAATAPKKPEPVDELAAFKALLNGAGRSGGRDSGSKPGIDAREGSRGHEGDGTLRPGHDDAVSDVTTINLDSSAAEFDEARFAKRDDAKSRYFKALFRRVDGEWKADIAARGRFRAERGVVTMRIVVRRDGKLLEASEVERFPKGLADEYVNICKQAIQRACDPASDPFPPELRKFEKLECQAGFGY